MNLLTYPLITNESHDRYEFLSAGPNGTVKKVVLYQHIGNGIYNLAFGDWNEIKQAIDDYVRTNNSDRDKVIATVASTVLDFMDHRPEANIVAKGSTPAKTRLSHWKPGKISLNLY